jgi:archaellum component FlaC
MLQTRVFQYLILSLLLTFYSKFSFAQNFTEEDRARMIRTETKLEALEKRMEDGFNQIDKRFEQVDKRFDQVDKRFDQVDKRFEQVDKRFEEHLNYIGYMVGIFGAICAVIIGFTLWDRRTMLKPLEVKVQAIDNELLKVKNNRSNQSKIISVLRELAKSNTKLAEILKWHKLL